MQGTGESQWGSRGLGESRVSHARGQNSEATTLSSGIGERHGIQASRVGQRRGDANRRWRQLSTGRRRRWREIERGNWDGGEGSEERQAGGTAAAAI